MTKVSRSVRLAASYRIGVVGYGCAMAFSVLGEVPIALLFIVAASVAAAALFLSAAPPASRLV